ncbi:GGDEF domain-containing protein [Tsukamurella sputi]|uniref:GGDEF domain-containing protein n=1 Tax=Tsukamurella sputi TaxID=2591848 RepID=UPI00131569E3|nr:GGDEF domain-containing protein [Tsukamurella sputi]
MKKSPYLDDEAAGAVAALSHWVGYVGTTWWRGGPDYRERIEYFTNRTLLRGFRSVVSVCALLLGAMSAALLFVDMGGSVSTSPDTARLIRAAGAAVGLFWAVRWQVGAVPSERCAGAFVLTSTMSIVAVSWADVELMAGVAGLSAIALVATFTAFMLSPLHLVAQSAVSAGALVLFVPPLVVEYGWVMTAIKFAMLAVVTVGVPACVQIGIAFLSQDAADSDSDPLTGVLNRRGFRRGCHRGILQHAAGRRRVPVAVMVVDVNDFKTVNDALGHDTGDAVLVRVAAVLRDVVPTAVVARIGGDEFAVALAGALAVDHASIADTLQREIGKVTVVEGAAVTASIGVALGTVRVDDRDGVELLLAEADEAMYRAKRAAHGEAVVTELRSPGEAGPASLAGGED